MVTQEAWISDSRVLGLIKNFRKIREREERRVSIVLAFVVSTYSDYPFYADLPGPAPRITTTCLLWLDILNVGLTV